MTEPREVAGESPSPGPPSGAAPTAEVRLLLFASAREAAGRRDDTFRAECLGALLEAARERYGPRFGAVLDGSRVWIGGEEPAEGPSTPLRDGDEVAVLPPVSGG